jgi:SAM-dependent methyltransferase
MISVVKYIETMTLFLSYIKRLWRGQTLARMMLNDGFSTEELKGLVVDIGGGRSPDYFDYFKKDNIKSVEIIDGSISGINFESDKLPFKDNTFDTAILSNVLEHIYNYNFLVSEIFRILKKEGRLIGFVPFLVNYHKDPNDYFRYTNEALEKIFLNSGFSDIKIVGIGGGPFFVNFNNIVLSLPRILRVSIFPFYYLSDILFLKFRPKSVARFPLGYMFIIKK